MSTRAEIEQLVLEAYDARHHNDGSGAGSHFAEECTFRIMASDRLSPLSDEIRGKAAVLETLKSLSDMWDMSSFTILDMWVDGETVIVRRGGPLRYVPTNTVIDTVMLDILKIHNGKITAFEEFVDTELLFRTIFGIGK